MGEDDTIEERRRAREAVVAEARRLYETTELKQTQIALQVGRSGSWVTRHIREGGWLRPLEAERRRALALNVRARIDEEVARAERVFQRAGAPAATDAEKTARTLAVLMRTLREITKYNDEQRARSVPAGGADDVYDVDEFRDTLADRLDRLRRERDAG